MVATLRCNRASWRHPCSGRSWRSPITDLQKLKEDSTKFSNNLVMQQLIGSGPHLREGSPAQNAERIQVPVLMVAGGLGHDSTIDQTRVMHGALSTAGKKVELIEYPGVAQEQIGRPSGRERGCQYV